MYLMSHQSASCRLKEALCIGRKVDQWIRLAAATEVKYLKAGERAFVGEHGIYQDLVLTNFQQQASVANLCYFHVCGYKNKLPDAVPNPNVRTMADESPYFEAWPANSFKNV
jgi:hypothetical protein